MPLSISSPDHPALTLLPEQPTRDEIETFGRLVLSVQDVGVADLNTGSIINPDLYGRGVTIPAGVFLVGLSHTQPGFAMCVGDITVWTEGARRRYTGAHILPTAPGHMRIGFAHAETTWFTVHANKTGTVDLRAIEDSLVEHPERLMTRRQLEIAPRAVCMEGAT